MCADVARRDGVISTTCCWAWTHPDGLKPETTDRWDGTHADAGLFLYAGNEESYVLSGSVSTMTWISASPLFPTY